MADDLSLSKLLSRHFRSSASGESSSLINRTRIDARTVGYPDEYDSSKISWYGMSPADEGDNNDLWRVVLVEEIPNKYLSQLSDNERLVRVSKSSDELMSFKKAMERLAVWELARMMKGTSPVLSEGREELGRHYFRDLAMRRGFLFDSTGDMHPASDILPQGEGKFLKSDLDALAKYHEELQGADKLSQLMSAQEALYITSQEKMSSESSVQEDLESFGEIALFEKMQFFSEILLEYAKVQLSYIEEFYGHPERFADHFANKLSLANRMNEHAGFFNPDMIDRINHVREQFAETIFKFYHVVESDWDDKLDFNSRAMRKQLLINPDAKETHEYMNREIQFPLDSTDVEQILFIAARSLMFCADMLRDSPQRDLMDRKDIFRQGDIKDLLNFLDLLDVKYMYTELAESAVALPHTQRYKDLKAQNAQFSARVDYLIANLKDSADWSPAQEGQIEDFIKANSEVYLIDKVADLPERLGKAHQYLSDKLLPRPHQLSLDFGVSQTPSIEEKYKKAAPTRKTESKGLWSKLGF